MNKVRVRLTPTKKAMTGFTAVGGVTIKLEAKGPAAGTVTATAQPAKLELVEVAGAKDKTTSDRVIYSLDGTIVDQSGVPFFDSTTNSPTRAFTNKTSDFGLTLTWDTTTFKVPLGGTFLNLPWESSAENFQMEVRARLTVAGAIEADLAQNDVLDVPMKHLAVPDDGTNTTDTSEAFGVTTVYPTKHDFLKASDRIPFAGKTLNVFIHDGVGTGLNGMRTGCYTFASVKSALTTILNDGGFGNLNIVEVTSADPKLTAVWTTLNGERVAKNVTDPQNIADNEGTDIPFFDYWIFFETTKSPQGSEAAQSESLNPNATKVDVAKATKRAIQPIFILKKSPKFLTALTAVLAADSANLIATLMAHEIGHSLGLRHGLDFDVGAGSYTVATEVGTMTGGSVDGGGHAVAQLFGPVHRDVIKKFYL
jgi:hypothetical protein